MSVTRARGFVASGLSCGIKDGGVFDLSLVASEKFPVAGAAVFTTNRATAAPVQVSQRHLQQSHGAVRAVIFNSGCANAATGATGLEAAAATCVQLAERLGASSEEILVGSTGLIGVPLPVEKILFSLDRLVSTAGSTDADAERAAQAILTTDTHTKQVVIEGDGFIVGGMAKGAGMIAPNLATMLVILTTDASVPAAVLSTTLKSAVDLTFNRLIVDGCTSTNDTVVLLASGEAGEVDKAEFDECVTRACRDLALQLAGDAEGTTKVVTITIKGATSKQDAERAGRQVAGSLLVKTSLYGADPYWGRVVSELGASGAEFELGKVSIAYGTTLICQNGTEIDHDRAAVAAHVRGTHVTIECDLGLGGSSATIFSTDIGHGYIDENMRTS